jgi:hypothetical protein
VFNNRCVKTIFDLKLKIVGHHIVKFGVQEALRASMSAPIAF